MNGLPFKFHPGVIVSTPGVQRLGINFVPYLLRHLHGDWGDQIDAEDGQANHAALAHGGRLVSRYRLAGSAPEFIYIVTESDRSRTTILLPEEL